MSHDCEHLEDDNITKKIKDGLCVFCNNPLDPRKDPCGLVCVSCSMVDAHCVQCRKENYNIES